MKRMAILATTLLAAALMAIALVGCGGQASSSASSASASGSASASASAQSQDEIIADLKDALANEPAYKSVTLTEVTKATFKIEAEADESASSEAASSESAASEEPSSDNTIESTTVYKFDASGEKLKTDMTAEIEGITIRYCSDGDDAVCVTDGPVYSGTTEQFDESHFAGVEAYLEGAVGDLNTIVDCAATVEKEQQGDLAVYTLTLDPEKYMASDEILTMMKEYGDPVVSAVFTLGFDNEGHLASIHEVVEYNTSATDRTYTLSDFDSTVVDPMPAADKTFEEMEADINEKLEALESELDVTSEYQDAAASSDAAEAK